ncbi:hypothetical protein DY000_02041801 [Brassica cretica]|uniref:Uncharacterized protein n=1 Tax=Brassica cretica TaxID=69181 RepID=A0ABQ7BL55_BRACR|nr:hypothetical protein DY000_02041801 [Brassica cretica]
MPSSTRSNKETQLLFSPDPASLEHSIRKEARSSSTDNNTRSSLNFVQPPSTQTLVLSTDTRSPLSTEDTHLPSTDIVHPTSIDTPSQTSIDTEPRDMVATLILVRDDNGDLHDQEGHLRNAAGQRINAQGAAVPESLHIWSRLVTPLRDVAPHLESCRRHVELGAGALPRCKRSLWYRAGVIPRSSGSLYTSLIQSGCMTSLQLLYSPNDPFLLLFES